MYEWTYMIIYYNMPFTPPVFTVFTIHIYSGRPSQVHSIDLG